LTKRKQANIKTKISLKSLNPRLTSLKSKSLPCEESSEEEESSEGDSEEAELDEG